MIKQLKFGLLSFMIGYLLISCDLFKTEIIVDFDYNLLLTRKNAWNVLKPNNYQFNLLISGTGYYEPIDALIIVENGQYKEEFSNIEYGGATYYTYQTIDNIYETIENTYKEYNNTQRSKNEVYLKKIKVEYDSENNIPIKIEYFYYVPAFVADAGEYWVNKITDYKNND